MRFEDLARLAVSSCANFDRPCVEFKVLTSRAVDGRLHMYVRPSERYAGTGVGWPAPFAPGSFDTLDQSQTILLAATLGVHPTLDALPMEDVTTHSDKSVPAIDGSPAVNGRRNDLEGVNDWHSIN